MVVQREDKSKLEVSLYQGIKGFIKFLRVRGIQKKFSEDKLEIIDIALKEDKYKSISCPDYIPSSGICLYKLFQSIDQWGTSPLECDHKENPAECSNYDDVQALQLLNEGYHSLNEKQDKFFD